MMTARQDKAERFYLQSLVREIADSDHRIHICMRHLLPQRETVEVHCGEFGGWFRGVQVCGNAWYCPVCAVRLAAIRRSQLESAIDSAKEAGYVPFFVTYTLSHGPADSLQDTLNSILAAYRFTRSGRKWQYIKTEYDVLGSIRATEVTHGENGFHPHFHELLFVKAKGTGVISQGYEYTANAIERHIYDLWTGALAKQNKTVTRDHGIKVKFGTRYIADYIAKFDRLPTKTGAIAYEVANSTTKKGRGENKTMFEVLHAYGLGEDTDRNKAIFREYMTATHGKSVLQFTRGLKEKLGIGVQDDESELLDAQPGDTLLCELTAGEWRIIKKYNVQAAILSCADAGDRAGIYAILDILWERELKAIDKRWNKVG